MSPPRCAVPAYPFCILLQQLHQAGFKRARLAALVGFSAPALRHIEIGQTKWLYPRTAAALRSLAPLLEQDAVA